MLRPFLTHPVVINVATVCALSVVVLGVTISYLQGGLVADLFSTELDGEDKRVALQAAFEAWGPLAPVAYTLFVTAEVVIAPLPGLMLYAPGGIIFGGFLGGLYALIGNMLGAALACQIMRILGMALFGPRIRDSLGRLGPVLDRRGVWVVFFLRVNPLTSSDLVSYAAGLTQMPTWKVVLGTAMGMAPLCWIQAYLADGLLTAFPNLMYPLTVACLCYLVAVVWFFRRMLVAPSVAPQETVS